MGFLLVSFPPLKCSRVKKVIVCVTNDLQTDQRVYKVCQTLFELGYELLLVGRELPASAPLNRPYQTKRFQLFFNRGFLFYAEYNLRLFLLLLSKKKDIVLANDLDTLLPAYLSCKLTNSKLVFDSHELFPEIPELVHRPKVKAVWESLENFLLPKIQFGYTVSQSIVDHYQEKYHRKFQLVRNIPIPEAEVAPYTAGILPTSKFIIYQGAVNIGRGLELMLAALPLLPEFKFVIVGTGDIYTDLQEHVRTSELTHQVVFTGKLAPAILRSITPQACVGMSLEEDLGLNYRYALPNKIFDYLHAEIPVIVSDLPEMKKVVANHGIGEVLQQRTPEQLALQLRRMVKTDYATNLLRAKKQFSWQREAAVLGDIFKQL